MMKTSCRVLAFSFLLIFSFYHTQLKAVTSTKYFSDNDGIIDNDGIVLSNNKLSVAFNVLPDNDSNIIGCWRLDETSGPAVSDSSGNDLNGSLQNMESGDRISGVFNNAIELATIEEYVSIDDDVLLDGFSDFTLECWVKLKPISDNIPAPALRYKLDDNDSYSVVRESIGEVNGALVDNAPGGDSSTNLHSVDGAINSGLEFDGQYEYIDCNNVGNITGDISFAAWVYVDNDSLSHSAHILGKNSAGCYRLRINTDGTIWLLLNDGSGYDLIESTSAINFQEWEHIAVTVDFNTQQVKFYINGDLKETETTTKTQIASSYVALTIGTDWVGGTTQMWLGYLDDIRLYDEALSEEQVAYIYKKSEYVTTGQPALHYRMNDNDTDSVVIEYNDSSDGAFNDDTGNSNTNAHAVQGIIGGALEFDGVDDYINCGQIGNITGDISFAAWVYVDNDSLSHNAHILGKNSAGCYRLIIDTDRKIRLLLNDGTSSEVITSTSTINFQEWEHVVVTVDFDTQQVKFYINGDLKETETTTETKIATSPVPLTIGTDWSGGRTQMWLGYLDDIRIYKYTITDSEVTAIYNNGNGTESENFSQHDIIAKTADNDSSYSISVTSGSKKISAELITSSGSAELTSDISLSEDEWTHLALTYDNTGACLYINGDVSDSSSLTGNILNSSADLTFGPAEARNFNILVDEVFLLDDSLSESEIVTYYRTSSFVLGKLLNENDNAGSLDLISINISGLDEDHEAFIMFSDDGALFYDNEGSLTTEGIELNNNGLNYITLSNNWSQCEFYYKIIFENKGYSEGQIDLDVVSLSYEQDTDNDGILDITEMNLYDTDPYSSDNDSLYDVSEVNIDIYCYYIDDEYVLIKGTSSNENPVRIYYNSDKYFINSKEHFSYLVKQEDCYTDLESIEAQSLNAASNVGDCSIATPSSSGDFEVIIPPANSTISIKGDQ